MKWRVEWLPYQRVWRAYPVCGDRYPHGLCPCRNFDTHAEAIAYAHWMARR